MDSICKIGKETIDHFSIVGLVDQGRLTRCFEDKMSPRFVGSHLFPDSQDTVKLVQRLRLQSRRQLPKLFPVTKKKCLVTSQPKTYVFHLIFALILYLNR